MGTKFPALALQIGLRKAAGTWRPFLEDGALERGSQAYCRWRPGKEPKPCWLCGAPGPHQQRFTRKIVIGFYPPRKQYRRRETMVMVCDSCWPETAIQINKPPGANT